MKPVHKHLVAAACLAMLGLSASAQPAQPGVVVPGSPPSAAAAAPGRTAWRQEHFARMQQRMARRDAALKAILEITPAQEGAWDQWVASRRPAANMQRPHRGQFAQLTTPQRIDRMRQLRAARDAEMDRRADATKTFYAALSPAQQKAFDALPLAMGGFGHHHGGFHRGGWGARG